MNTFTNDHQRVMVNYLFFFSFPYRVRQLKPNTLVGHPVVDAVVVSLVFESDHRSCLAFKIDCFMPL